MNLVNLTPHALTIHVPNDTPVILPASGSVARCQEISEPRGDIDGIPVVTTRYGDVSNLPDPQKGTLYLVSALVRLAVPHRSDVASPGTLIRDGSGNPIGCQGLIVNP